MQRALRPRQRASASAPPPRPQRDCAKRPRPPPSEVTSVVVIGAGLAGLACARELSNEGFVVEVLEARDRIGGRVCTDYFSGGSVGVDTGASFIHGIEKNPVAEMAQTLGVDLYERVACPLYDFDGSLVDKSVDERVESAFNRMLARAAERKRFARAEESLEEAVQAVLPEEFEDPASPLAGIDAQQARRILHWHLSNLEYSVNSDLTLVRNNGWDQDDPFGLDGAHAVVGTCRGMSCVVDTLGRDLDIRLESRVRRIVYSDHGVRVEFEANDGVQRHVEAHAAVVTVPLGVLQAKTIDFSPPLPRLKHKAIENLGFGLLNKVALLFPHVFWGDENREMFGYCSERRGESPIFVDLSHDGGSPVLCVLISGSFAETLEGDSDAHCVTKVMAVLCTIFGKDKVPDPLEARVTRWKADPFSRGSFSFVKVGSRPADYDTLMSPVGVPGAFIPRVFFAGEHTNRYFPASVHGALFSGLREARRLAGMDWFDGDGKHNSDGLFVEETLNPSMLSLAVFAERYAPSFQSLLSCADSSSSSSLDQLEHTRKAGRVFLSKLVVPLVVEESEDVAPTADAPTNHDAVDEAANALLNPDATMPRAPPAPLAVFVNLEGDEKEGDEKEGGTI